eukprot:10316292-Alexandrium_andersonii.AAC.1
MGLRRPPRPASHLLSLHMMLGTGIRKFGPAFRNGASTSDLHFAPSLLEKAPSAAARMWLTGHASTAVGPE